MGASSRYNRLPTQPVRLESEASKHVMQQSDTIVKNGSVEVTERTESDSIDFRARAGPNESRIERLCFAGLVLLTVLFAAVFTARSFRAFDRIGMGAFDLGIFDQAIWLISRGQSPLVTVRGCHILADHFSIILYPLAPLYWLWPNAKALFIIQSGALAAGAFPIYAMARKRMGAPVYALMMGACYLAFPALQWTAINDFHPESLAPVLLLGALYYLDRRRWRAYAVCLTVAALTKETVGASIVALGLCVLFLDRRAGVLTIIGGALAWSVASVTMWMFSHGAPNPYWSLYAHYGGSPASIAAFALTHPVRLASDLGAEANRIYLFQLFYPLLFLPLMAPGASAAAAPALMAILLWSRPKEHLIESYYSTLVIPFLFWGAVAGFDRLRRAGNRYTTAACAVCLGAAAVDAAVWWPASTERETAPRASAESALAVLAGVPPEASISTQSRLVPHVTHRTRVYDFPNPFLSVAFGISSTALGQEFGRGLPSYTAHSLQRTVDTGPVEYVALTADDLGNAECAAAVLASPSYGIVDIQNATILLRRGAPHGDGMEMLRAASGASGNRLETIRDVMASWRRRIRSEQTARITKWQSVPAPRPS